MPTDNSFSLQDGFHLLTDRFIASAKRFFIKNPTYIKLLRKTTDLPYSYISTDNKKIFAISRNTIGTGSTGKVKLAQNIDTKEIVAVKILFFNVNNLADYNNNSWKQDCEEETETLQELGQLHATVTRWWSNLIGIGLPHHSTNGWINKHEKDLSRKQLRYNLKYYIFTDYHDDYLTLYNYFKKNNPTIEKMLEIVIKVLEQLKLKLHNKNMLHCDFSGNNILIRDNENGEIEVKLIDYGFAGKVKNGIKKYPILGYTFDEHSYVAPESDYMLVLKEILPEISKYIDKTILKEIHRLAIDGHGFNTTASDLYSLTWSVCAYGGHHPTLLELFDDIREINPYARPTIDTIINRCQVKLQHLLQLKLERKQQDLQELALDRETIVYPSYPTTNSPDITPDFSSVFKDLGISCCSPEQLRYRDLYVDDDSPILTSYIHKSNMHTSDSRNTITSSNSSNALSACNISSDSLDDPQKISLRPLV